MVQKVPEHSKPLIQKVLTDSQTGGLFNRNEETVTLQTNPFKADIEWYMTV